MDFGYTDVVHYLEFGHGVNKGVGVAPAHLRREQLNKVFHFGAVTEPGCQNGAATRAEGSGVRKGKSCTSAELNTIPLSPARG